MFALGIIAVALMGILSMIVAAQKNKESMRELTLAKETAAAKLEEIRSQAYTAIPTTYGTGQPGQYFNVQGLFDPTNTGGGKLARGEVRLVTQNSELLDITVVVSWKGVSGPRNYSLRTLVAR
jgi:type II secretory pathway pseudopilin PulG